MRRSSPENIQNPEQTIEWEQYQQEISDLLNTVIETGKSKYGNRISTWIMENIRYFYEKASKDKKHPDRYVAMKKLIGTTANMTTSPLLDLAPPYNVKDFLNHLLSEFRGTTTNQTDHPKQ